MAALPKTIMQELGRSIAPSKYCTMEQMRKKFAEHGYGIGKFGKWLNYFQSNEIITFQDDGTFTCIWW